MEPLRYRKLQSRWAMLSVAGVGAILLGYLLQIQVVGWTIGFLLIILALLAFIITGLAQLFSRGQQKPTENDALPVEPRPGPFTPPPAPIRRVDRPLPAPSPTPVEPVPAPEPEVGTEDMEVHPEDGATVYSAHTYVRWQPFPDAAGRVLWREAGQRDFLVAERETDAPELARLGPLTPRKSYEYYVEQQQIDARTWRSEVRRFRTETGLEFVPTEVEATVARDYDQTVRVAVRNVTNAPIRVVARALPHFDDLPADLTGRGSTDEPVELPPGQTLELRLAVNAADAARTDYRIPIDAGGAAGEVRVSVPRPDLKLSLRVVSEDGATLAKRVELRNDGATIGDLAITLAPPARDEARIEPSVGHGYLQTAGTLQLTVTPLLYLEFDALDAVLECAAAGQTARFPLEFRAPAGKRLLGIRTASQHQSCANDWVCTNRPDIWLRLAAPLVTGMELDELSWWVHLALDAAGMLPGVGIIPDAINAGIYWMEGNEAEMLFSMAAMIPILGDGAMATKYGLKLTREAAERLTRREIQEAVMRSAYGRPHLDELTAVYRRMQRSIDANALEAARRAGPDAYRDFIGRSFPSYSELREDTRRFHKLYKEAFPQDWERRLPTDLITDRQHDVHHILEARLWDIGEFRNDLRRLGFDGSDKMPSIVLPTEFHIRSPRKLGPREFLDGRWQPTELADVDSLTWILRRNVDPRSYRNDFPGLIKRYEEVYRAHLNQPAWAKVEPLFDYFNSVLNYRGVS